MKPLDIQTVLNNFLYNSNYKSILIDGEWGCGKTFETTKFLKNNPKLNVAYVSMFGIETLDELNTCIYHQTHKLKNKIIATGRTFSKIIQMVPKAGQPIGNFIEETLSSYEKNADVQYTLIIVDDLERLSKKISYQDLLGYFNSLLAHECRLLCLVNSNKIDPEKRKSDYADFVEKIFNDYYLITEKNECALKDIFGELYTENSTYLSVLPENLRYAEKTKYLFDRVTQLFADKKKQISDFGYDNSILIVACYFAIHISFDAYEYYQEDKSSFSEMYIRGEYGDRVGGKLIQLKEKYKDIFCDVKDFWELVAACSHFYLFMNDKIFLSHFFIEEKDNDSILNKHFYYLSDANKTKYCEELHKQCLDGLIAFSNAFENAILAAISYCDYSNDEAFIDSILKIYADADSIKEIDDIINVIQKYDENGKKSSGLLFFEKLSEKADIYKTNKEKKIICSTLKSNDYQSMIDIIHTHYTLGNAILLNELEENNYYCPDLSGDINQGMWSYCHEMTKFIAKYGDKTKFIEFAKNKCKANINNRSMVDRYYSLIKYYIDPSISKNNLIG